MAKDGADSLGSILASMNRRDYLQRLSNYALAEMMAKTVVEEMELFTPTSDLVAEAARRLTSAPDNG